MLLYFLSTFTLFVGTLFGAIDLDQLSQDFVLERKKINIPGFPAAYNPSIISWKGCYLLSFRVLTDPTNLWHSKIGLIWLDPNFSPISPPQLLNTRVHNPHVPSRSEDARLFSIGERLYLIYNDNEEISDGQVRRMHIAEVNLEGPQYSVYKPKRIEDFPGENPKKWEKNWIPFENRGKLLLAYSVVPHHIFLPNRNEKSCTFFCSTQANFPWPWGEKRLYGGTPALKVDNEYLAFFHSSIEMPTVQSGPGISWHYFMGAYTFQPHPPFAITKVSPLPILGKGMYHNPTLWKRVIFPGGFVFDDKHIWVVYGREDSEVWVMKLDKRGLLDSLVAVR